MDVMDNILEFIYNMFMDRTKDLAVGHTLENKDLCKILEFIQMYELLDSDMISLKEQKQIIKYYG